MLVVICRRMESGTVLPGWPRYCTLSKHNLEPVINQFFVIYSQLLCLQFKTDKHCKCSSDLNVSSKECVRNGSMHFHKCTYRESYCINQTLWSWFWPITTHLNNQPVLFCASGTYKSEIEDINSIL